jgi:carbon monoxide dehydrogenase subunit G
MATIEGEIFIDRPPEVVFDIVADERNEPRYNQKMTAVSLLSDPPIGHGSRFVATMKSWARTFTMTIEFTDFERPTRLGSVSTVGAMRTVGALTFEPQGSGTLMRWSWNIRLRGVAKLTAPVVSWMGRRQERAIARPWLTIWPAPTSPLIAGNLIG